MRCNICNKELDNAGNPIQYCDYQQGRCPKQKHSFNWNNKLDKLIALILVPAMFLFVLIYVELY